MLDLPKIMGGWRVIYIDPPWRFTNQGTIEGTAEAQYGTMSDQSILNLSIRDISAIDSELWLWSTNAHLPLAFRCMERWGFEYKGMITWVKNTLGMGFWLRGTTEQLLLGIRGHPDRDKFVKAVLPTHISWSNPGHSSKPGLFYEMIERVSEPPRLEIFARKRREGWTAFGNQVENEIQKVL